MTAITESERWHTTGSLHVAMVNGYIGEVQIIQNPISAAIHEILTGQVVPEWRMYYFGKRDKRLSEMFGYESVG